MTSIDDIPIQPDRQKKRSVGQIVSIGISIVALVVSGLSFWQSKKNAALQNELSRPLLKISTMEERYSEDSHSLQAIVKLKNIGHLTAKPTKYEDEGFHVLARGTSSREARDLTDLLYQVEC